jgi:hypothetical protein
MKIVTECYKKHNYKERISPGGREVLKGLIIKVVVYYIKFVKHKLFNCAK